MIDEGTVLCGQVGVATAFWSEAVGLIPMHESWWYIDKFCTYKYISYQEKKYIFARLLAKTNIKLSSFNKKKKKNNNLFLKLITYYNYNTISEIILDV